MRTGVCPLRVDVLLLTINVFLIYLSNRFHSHSTRTPLALSTNRAARMELTSNARSTRKRDGDISSSREKLKNLRK